MTCANLCVSLKAGVIAKTKTDLVKTYSPVLLIESCSNQQTSGEAQLSC